MNDPAINQVLTEDVEVGGGGLITLRLKNVPMKRNKI